MKSSLISTITRLCNKHLILLNCIIPAILYSILGKMSVRPLAYWPLGFIIPAIAIIPLHYLIKREKLTFRTVLLLSFSFGIISNCYINFWILNTIKIYGGLTTSVAFFLFILYSAIASSKFLIFYILAYFYYLNERNNNNTKSPLGSFAFIKSPLYYSLAWVIAEKFGWSLYPHFGATAISNNNTIIQIADIIGIRGLSFFWFLWGYTIYIFLTQVFYRKALQRNFRNAKNIYIISGITFIFIYTYGIFIPIYWNNQKTNIYSQYAVIQGDTELKISKKQSRNASTKSAIDTMYNLSYNFLKKENSHIDLVIWPEGAIPFASYKKNNYLYNATQSLINEFNTSIIINDIFFETKQNKKKYYSRFLLINPNEEILTSNQYNKIYLLPFGEYIPYGSLFPQIYKIFPTVSNFSKGEKINLIPLKSGIQILPTICYEVTSSEFIQKNFKQTQSKADIIINLTNDKWFGKTTEPYQHLDIVRLRSVELRKPMIRSTNSGISTYIDIFGNTNLETKIFEQDAKKYSIPVYKGNTLYNKIGNLPLYILCIIYMSFYFIQKIYKKFNV